MKKSVGLVAMVSVLKADGSAVLRAVLQRRGQWNTEKGEPKSYPGCVQVTCHGKLEDEDGGDFQKALVREATEELGVYFANWLKWDAQLTVLSRVDTGEKQVITYSTIVPMNVIWDISLGRDTGGLYWVTVDQIADTNTDLVAIDEHDETMKTSGPRLTRTIAMFPDEIEAVRKAFEIFGQ